MKRHARVAVIGGGAMGTSLIYHLTGLGWDDVVLIEKNELTAGSTWHAAGLCTHYAHNLTIMQMRAHSVELYRHRLEAETVLAADRVRHAHHERAFAQARAGRATSAARRSTTRNSKPRRVSRSASTPAARCV